MASKPYLTSDDLIESVARRISMPIYQQTFSRQDVLEILNEEMQISMVPSVLQYHEEYYVYPVVRQLETNRSKYPVPDRAIGMRLRDLMWSDSNGNLFEMARIDDGDKAYFQRNLGVNAGIHKFYMEGNDVVLSPSVSTDPTGYLNFYIFIRPNQLVKNDRAATITAFLNKIVVDNTSLTAGDTVTIDDIIFTAVVGSPSTDEFQIGATSIDTATNLAIAINTNGICSANVGIPPTATIVLSFDDISNSRDIQVSNSTSFAITTTNQIIQFDVVNTTYTDSESNVTENLFQNGVKIDLLQTKPGHRIINYDIKIPSNGISDNTISFNIDDIPTTMEVGDYICLANEAIIPYLPPDLHSSLAEKAAARILASIGDQQGLQMSMEKLAEMEKRQGNLLDNRVDNAPSKVLARHSILHWNRISSRRRY